MAKTYEPIATTTLTSAASSITFSSISGSYTDLRLVLVPPATYGAYIYLRFNSDTGSNYSRTYLSGNGSAASSSRDTSQTYIKINNLTPDKTNLLGFYTVDIFSYAGSTNKTVLATSNEDNNGSGYVDRIVGLWRSTSAITSVGLTMNGIDFQTGTVATLYGILKA